MDLVFVTRVVWYGLQLPPGGGVPQHQVHGDHVQGDSRPPLQPVDGNTTGILVYVFPPK